MGCGSSFTRLSSKNTNKVVDSTATSDTSPGKSGRLPPIVSTDKREVNLEPFTLVSLEKTFAENDDELRAIIDYMCYFKDVDQCENYLKDSSRKTGIFFIVSHEYVTRLISRVHDLPTVVSIYIYQTQKSKQIDKSWTKRYAKIRGIYGDRETLLEQIASDVQVCMNLQDVIPITVYSRVDAVQATHNSTDHLRFLVYQLFLRQHCSKSSNHHEFVKLAQKYYASNRRELKSIKLFSHDYSPSRDLLPWFATDCFVRRLLTQSLVTLDISTLFALRFFIHDMHKFMAEAASMANQKQSFYQGGSGRFTSGRSGNEKLFYRGQALAKETLLKIKSNIGEMLSMNNFVYASKNRQDCLELLRQYVPYTDQVYRVLFELKVPWTYSLQKQRPFVDLNSLHKSSSLDDSEEIYSILFYIGSIFRITSVEHDRLQNCWTVHLTLYDEQTNEDFSQVFTFLEQAERETGEHSSTLPNLLRQISSDSAEQLYKHLLQDSRDSRTKLECYRGLGLCAYSHNDYDQALSYFEKALHLRPTDDMLKSSLHNSLGLVHAQQDQTDRALDHFTQALELSSLPTHTACVHHNLALIYSRQGQYEEELEHYKEALKIRTRHLPTQHVQVASLHNNIGIAHSDMHDYTNSLSSLKTALEIRLKLLSESHIDVARSYANIGTVYSRTQEFTIALDYFNKAQMLLEKQPQLPEDDLEQLKRNIKIVNDKLRRKTC